MGSLLKLLPFVVLLAACSDYNVTKIAEENPAPVENPDIQVDPTFINFGSLDADGDSTTEIVTITNNGTDTLDITSRPRRAYW